jgi:uncharacterized protein (UPF0332 family)
MLNAQDHLALAEKNEQFAEAVSALPQRFPEWEITALFYSALHYASAFLATQGHHPENHSQRNNLVRNLTNIGEDYRNLYSLSRDARYRGVAFTPQRVGEIKDGPFRRVKEGILALLPS